MSNSYVNKIFSEQPLAVWALDDDVSYLSLIDSFQRTMEDWTYTNGATEDNYDQTTEPYYVLGETVKYISKINVSSSGNFIATSTTASFSAPNDYFNIGFYYFKNTPYVSSIEIGYKVGATTTYAAPISTTSFYEWTFISAKFDSFVGNAEIVIKFNYAAPAVTDTVSILINGLTVGEVSEVSNRESLGASIVGLESALDSATGLSCSGVRMYNHGSEDQNGYYIVDENGKLCARSTATTMVYGGKTSVTITPAANGNPSIAINGFGIFDNIHRHRSRTLEMWLRIKTKATQLTRIVGPVTSDDGLYVKGPFLVLKAGKYTDSYYVGEWQRPMLVQISTSPEKINVFINGGNAISINIDEVPDFGSQYEVYDTTGPQWIGFYATQNVPQIDIDAIAVYPYELDEEKSLRRFGYAQAVKFPENLIAAHGGQTMYPDYAFANYGKSKSYGNNLKDSWDTGYYDNFIVESNILKTIKSETPSLEIDPTSNLTSTQFFEDLSTVIGSSTPFIDLQPGSNWSGVNSHLVLSPTTITKITDSVAAIYIEATRSENNTSKQTLFSITGMDGYIEVYAITSTSPTTSNNIVYSFVHKGTTTNFASISGNTIGTNFIAGLDMYALRNSGIEGMTEFLSSGIRYIYVGGLDDFSSTFTGKIYNFSISNGRNRLGIKDFFTDGVFSGTLSDLSSHYATYSVNAKKVFGVASLDTSSNSYWRDYAPLYYFSRKTQTSSNVYQNKIDMLQINIDTPKPITFSGGNYDTSNSSVKTYVTFKVDDISAFTIKPLGSGNLVTPDTDWQTSAYEVVDGTLIKIIDAMDPLQTSAVFHIVANSDDSSTYQTTIRSLQVGSIIDEPYDTSKSTTMTRYGVGIDSYQTDTEDKNLFIMPRYADEYYYLSNNSGIKLVGSIDGTYGYRMPLNKDLADSFNIGALHLSAKFAVQEFSTTPVLLFYISVGDNEYRFYADSYNSSNSRAKIYATYYDGSTESDYESVEYYLNNTIVDFPVVNADEWFILNINFKDNISLDDTEGSISFPGPLLINSLSYVQLSDEQKSQQVLVENIWIDTKYSSSSVLTWNYWASSSRTWNTVNGSKSASTGVSGFDSQELYRSITKTGVISTGYESNQKILSQSFKYFVYSGIVSDNKTIPVT